MIVVLSDEQLERIEDALKSALFLHHDDAEDAANIAEEIEDALRIVQAARALLAA